MRRPLHSPEGHALFGSRLVILLPARGFLAVEVEDNVIHLLADSGIVGQHLVTEARGWAIRKFLLLHIHPELYSIYQAAKTISVGGDNIVIEDLAFSELVSDRAFRLILGALLLCRYGEVVLNLERKTEETT